MTHYRLKVFELGQGPTVIFLHGMAASSRYWAPIIRQLSVTNRCVAPDLLGFGQSPKPSRARYSLDDHVNAIINSIRLEPTEPVIIAAHSMGCILATEVAHRLGARVQKLVLISPPVFMPGATAREAMTSRQLKSRLFLYGPTAFMLCKLFCATRLSRVLLPLWHKGWPAEVIQDASRHTWRSYSRTMKAVLEGNPMMGRLHNAPAILVIYGQNDPLMRQAALEALRQYPNIKIKCLSEAGHHPVLEAQDEVARILASEIGLP
jgi:cis-3-alkyl-4-acyloxetan-2-one decarboxylase